MSTLRNCRGGLNDLNLNCKCMSYSENEINCVKIQLKD